MDSDSEPCSELSKSDESDADLPVYNICSPAKAARLDGMQDRSSLPQISVPSLLPHSSPITSNKVGREQHSHSPTLTFSVLPAASALSSGT